MRKIQIINKKGGVGKTATAINLASVLAKELKRKVLLVDCDSQRNATMFLTTSAKTKVEYDLIDVLKGVPIRNAIVPIKFKVGKSFIDSGIDLIAASRELEDVVFEEAEGDFMIFSELLKELEEDYDYCIFDCHPSFSTLEKSIMCAADYLITPAMLDTDSLVGYDSIIDVVNSIKGKGYNYNLEILGILYTFVMPNATMDKLCKVMFDRGFDNLPFEATIRCAMQTFKQSRHMSLPLNYYKPIDSDKKPELVDTTVTGDYIRLAKEVEKRINMKERG